MGCVCDKCIQEYQERPLSPIPSSPPIKGDKRLRSDMEESDMDVEPELKKFNIPYPDILLEDTIVNLKILRPEDYDDVEETVTDFCSAKNPDPEFEASEPDPEFTSEMDWYMWRPIYIDSYRTPAGYVFGHWVTYNEGCKSKPKAKLYTPEEAIQMFCPLNMVRRYGGH